MWGDPGKTIRRDILDQQVVTAMGGTANLVPFQPFRTVGYMAGGWLSAPRTAMAPVLNAATLVLPAGNQFPQTKIINNVQLNLQGSINIANYSGFGLSNLGYIRSGRKFESGPSPAIAHGWNVPNAAAPGTFTPNFNFPTADTSLISDSSQFVPYVQYLNSGPSGQLGYMNYVPISEFLIWPNAAVGAAQGGATIYCGLPMEFGLIYMQSDQQNLNPQVTLGSLYGANNESVFIATGGAVNNIASQQWTWQSSYYDVPPNVADRPNQLMSRYLITRQEQTIQIGGQAVQIKHRTAGILLAVLYWCYNDTGVRGTLVDMTQTQNTQMAFRAGSTTTKIQQTVQQNAQQCYDFYGYPPPGIAVIDLRQGGDGYGWGQAVDTAKLVDVRTEFTGLPAAATRMQYLEIRAIPIQRPTAAVVQQGQAA